MLPGTSLPEAREGGSSGGLSATLAHQGQCKATPKASVPVHPPQASFTEPSSKVTHSHEAAWLLFKLTLATQDESRTHHLKTAVLGCHASQENYYEFSGFCFHYGHFSVFLPSALAVLIDSRFYLPFCFLVLSHFNASEGGKCTW